MKLPARAVLLLELSTPVLGGPPEGGERSLKGKVQIDRVLHRHGRKHSPAMGEAGQT